MRTASSRRALIGFVLLASCDGGAAQTGGGGNGGGGARGGGGGQAGGGADAGGTGGGSACGTVSACGGDVVGTWQVTQSCVTGTEDLSSVCAGSTADVTFTFSGTTTYNADHSYTSTNGGGGTTHYHSPTSCLPGGVTCDQWGQGLMQAGMYSSVACATDSSGVCNCDAVSPSTSATETGTYSISGGMLTTTHGGTTATGSYCVEGSTLYEIPAFGDGGVAFMGSIVLTKQ
jgi:hypothetical protein